MAEKNEKLVALAAELTPYLVPHLKDFLDRLKNAGPDHSRKQDSARERGAAPHSLYLPEVDLFIHAGTLNNDFRRCGFSRKGSLNMEPLRRGDRPVGLFIEGGNNDALQRYIIPCASLKLWVDKPYDVKYTWDYRLHKASFTRYMAGVIDVARDNEPAKNNLRVRELMWRESDGSVVIPQKVIDSTRDYWDTMPDDGGSHIVTKETMMEVLDLFESGLLVPGQVPWRIDVTQTGAHILKKLHDADKTDMYQPIKVSLVKGG